MTLIDKQSKSNATLKAEPLEDAIRQLVERTVKEHEHNEIQEQIKVNITIGNSIKKNPIPILIQLSLPSRSTASGIKFGRLD